MASINERPKKSGGSSWQVYVRIPGQPKIVQSFDSKEEAEEFGRITEEKLRQVQQKVAKVALRSPNAEEFLNLTLKSVLKTFSDTPACSKGSKANMPTVYRFIGDTKIGEINKAWIRAFIAKMRGGMSRRNTPFTWATILKHLETMNTAVRWQAEEFNISFPRLPFDQKRMFPKDWENKRNRRLEPSEYVAIMTRFRQIDSPSKIFWRYLIRLAIETAARQQELMLAEWREIDLDRRLWVIPARHTKTKAERTVPLSMRAVRILKMLSTLKKSDSNQIFHFLKNAAVVCALFRRYAREANVENFRFHDLRHEGISRMVLYKRKLSVYEIMEIVGHNSMDMLKRYANIRKDELVGRMD